MADVKSATLSTGTKVTGPAHVVDAMVGRKVEAEKPKPAKKAAAKSEK